MAAKPQPVVELYHFWSSVCSVRCRMALEEKGVPWTSRYIDIFAFQHLTPEFLAINPNGTVPTLVYNGEPIRDLITINEFIDQAFDGPKLIPTDPVMAARMREFIMQCEESFGAIVKLTMVKYILPKLLNRWSRDELLKQAERRPAKFLRDVHSRAVRGEITQAELDESLMIIEKLLDHLEAILTSSTWIIGDEISLADITIAPYVFRLSALGQDKFWSKDRRPHVAQWYKSLSTRPSFQKAVSWPDETGGGYEEVGLKTTMPT